jgi:tetratricopeptide (TPR) repeat protein
VVSLKTTISALRDPATWQELRMFAVLRSMPRLLVLTMLLAIGPAVLLLPGCGAKKEAADAKKEGEGEAAKNEKPPFAARENVTTIDGRWMVVFTEQRKDFIVGLWDIDPKADPAVKIFEDLKILQEPQIKSAKVDGENITIDLQLGKEQKAVIRGKLQKGVIFGTLSPEPAGIGFVRMFPVTSEMVTAKELKNSLPTIGTEEFKKAAETKTPIASMWGLAQQAPQLPISFEAMTAILAQMSQMSDIKWTPEKFAEFEKDYLAIAGIWGEPMVLTARVNLAMQMTMQRLFPQQAITQFEEAEKLTDNKLIKDQLKIGRRALDMVLSLEAISQEGAASDKAAEDLRKFLETEPYNPEVLNALADYSLKTKKSEEAIEYLSQLVALPQLEAMILQARAQQGTPAGQPGPRENLIKLWKESHGGSLDGLEPMLQKLYDSTFETLRQESLKLIPPVELAAGHHVPLIESFTGVGCPPCLASAIAMESLVATYPIPAISVLHYHMNIPTPDPLTNQDGEDRFAYYQGQAAPSVFVDGRPVPGIGGILQHVGMSYARLRGEVDAGLKEQATVKLSATAEVKDGELTVNAVVDTATLPKEQDALRLRVALVENVVVLPGPNGIIEHHFVVRRLLGGAKGVGLKNDALKYSTTVPMADIRQGLTEGLAELELNRSIKFEVKPLDLVGLSLVAWVQDDQNRRVLGSIMLPVTGSGESKRRVPVTSSETATPPKTETPATEAPKDAPPKTESSETPTPPKPATTPEAEAKPPSTEPTTEKPKEEPQPAAPPADSANPPAAPPNNDTLR